MYRKHHDERKRSTVESGSFEKKNYLMQIDKNGHKYLVENGYTNTYDKIQAEAEGRDINSMIAKALRGDQSVLDYNKIYGDRTQIPTDMLSFMNLKLKAEDTWNKLPLEIRKEYNNSIEEYLRDYGSEKWLKLHGIEIKEEPNTIVKETTTDGES